MLYKRDILNKLKSMAKRIKFVHICKQVVLAKLELLLCVDGLKNLCNGTRITVVLIMIFIGVYKPIQAKGIMIDNWIDLQNT